jgi:hypothetical protein
VVTAGTVAICCGETARFSAHAEAMHQVRVPPGTVVRYVAGPLISVNRNRAVDEMEGGWIWFVDDDNVPRPDTLERLLAHEVDIVQPLVMCRHDLTRPACLSDLDGRLGSLAMGPGLKKVAAVGTGGMLVRRRVFETVPPDWFRFIQEFNRVQGEDVYFCRRAREHGFDVWCDFDTPMGHIFPAVVDPVITAGRPRVEVNVGGRRLTV